MDLKTIKLLLGAVLYCLLGKQGLCGRPSESERHNVNISNIDNLAEVLSDKVLLLLKTYLDKNLLVSLVFPLKEDDNLMYELMEKTNRKMNTFWTLLTNDGVLAKSKYEFINPAELLNRPDVYMLTLQDDFSRFETLLEQLDDQTFFNLRAVFIFFKLTNECGQYIKPEIWVPYFSKLWSYNFLFVVVLVLSKCDFQLTVVTAQPFSPENQCRSPNVRGVHFQTFAPDIEDNPFIEKNPKHFNGCSFIAATAPYPPFTYAKQMQTPNNETFQDYVGGLEIELVRLISIKLRFSYELKDDKDAALKCIDPENMNSTEVFDFCFGGMVPYYKSMFRYDISFSYMYSELSWYVANASVAPQWKILINIFTLNVWILYFLVHVMIYILYNTLDEYEHKGCTTNFECIFKKGKIYLELFRIFLGSPTTLRQNTSHLKILYIAWTLFSLEINIAVVSSVFERFRNPSFEKEIKTIQDLRDSGLKVAATSEYFKMFQNSQFDNNMSIFENKIECISTDQCFENLFKYRNFSIIDRDEHVHYLVDLKNMKIHKILESLMSFGISILLRRGHPLTKDMNKVMMQAFEGGLIKRWEIETAWKFINKHKEEIPKETISPISLDFLQANFLFLIIGCTVALLVFIMEIFLMLAKQKCCHRV